MNIERLYPLRARKKTTVEPKKEPQNTTGLFSSDSFDIGAFFGGNEVADTIDDGDAQKHQPTDEQSSPATPNLLVTLRNDANEAIGTLTTQFSATTFAAGASLTSNVFSTLSSIVGSCGAFCAHSLGALGKAGSSLSSVSGIPTGVGGMNGFSVDSHGHFHLDGNIDQLSQATGLSKGQLLSGHFTAEDLVSRLFAAFGESVHTAFGFGLLEMLIESVFDTRTTLTAEYQSESIAA